MTQGEMCSETAQITNRTVGALEHDVFHFLLYVTSAVKG